MFGCIYTRRYMCICEKDRERERECTCRERAAKSKNMLEHCRDKEPFRMELDSFPCNGSHVWLPAVSNPTNLHGFRADLALKCAS